MTNAHPIYFPKTKKDAEKAGYKALTDAYRIGEYHLMEAALRHMRQGDIDYCLVNETDDKAAICIYRKPSVME